jgi:hypothetical protein
MSHLKLVGQDPPKTTRRKGGPRHEASVLTPEEERKARQAIRNIKDRCGTWACLADMMGLPVRARPRHAGDRFDPGRHARQPRDSGQMPGVRPDQAEGRVSRTLIGRDATRARKAVAVNARQLY